MMRSTSGKGPKRDPWAWAVELTSWLDKFADISAAIERRDSQAGRPCIVRLRERDDATGVATGGTAVLTLYATGSWTWGGDADVVAYVREPLDAHGLLPAKIA